MWRVSLVVMMAQRMVRRMALWMAAPTLPRLAAGQALLLPRPGRSLPGMASDRAHSAVLLLPWSQLAVGSGEGTALVWAGPGYWVVAGVGALPCLAPVEVGS